MTAPEIASAFNGEGVRTNNGSRWTCQKLYYILRNTACVGELVVGASETDAFGNRYASLDPVILESAHEPIVSREVFDRAQALLNCRAGNHALARHAASPYLLSGLLRCGSCGGRMGGASAKGGRYHYYVCLRNARHGRQACVGVRVQREALDSQVLEEVQEEVLAPGNLEALVHLVNEEMVSQVNAAEEKLRDIDGHLAALRGRLGRHYDALESGEIGLQDLAPRIKELREQIREGGRTKDALVAGIDHQQTSRVELKTILSYAKQLRSTLDLGTALERKAFLGSFIEEIHVRKDRVQIRYRLPLQAQEAEGLEPPVLVTLASGGGGGNRTRVRNCFRSASTGLVTRFDLGA